MTETTQFREEIQGLHLVGIYGGNVKEPYDPLYGFCKLLLCFRGARGGGRF